MRQFNIPQPPNPDDYAYKASPLEYNRALYRWASLMSNSIQNSLHFNGMPLDQAFTVGTGYTITTNIAGTSTGTQITNFICSLVASMQRKGFTSPTVQSGDT